MVGPSNFGIRFEALLGDDNRQLRVGNWVKTVNLLKANAFMDLQPLSTHTTGVTRQTVQQTSETSPGVCSKDGQQAVLWTQHIP